VPPLSPKMEADGLVRFAPNPHHQRAKLVVLTPAGKSAFAAAMKRQGAWASDVGVGLDARKIAAATAMLRSVRQRLENGTDNEANNIE
jgi:DNA-binding MarR family transcriptional regulator